MRPTVTIEGEQYSFSGDVWFCSSSCQSYRIGRVVREPLFSKKLFNKAIELGYTFSTSKQTIIRPAAKPPKTKAPRKKKGGFTSLF